MIRAWRASYAKMLAAVARFHRAGIQIVSGTDDVAGFAFQRELELYVKLIDGDPTQDISAVRNVALVLQDGEACYPASVTTTTTVSACQFSKCLC
jgi:hypothetical protein